MEFINIPRWSAKDVADWMKGLDFVLQPYINTILTKKVTGDRLLLMTTSQDLEALGMHKVGHQEIMLDAINLLCNLHYRQSVEDLQSVTLNLNTRTNCLTKFLLNRSRNGSSHAGRNGTNVPQSVPASVLVLVAEIVTAAKTVISWLDRPPFVTGDHFFKMFREDILKSALELTQVGQQTGPLPQIEERLLDISQELGDFSDNLVKKASDPLIIQTSTIDFVSVKKKRSEEELGLEIRTSAIDGTHLITLVKPNSASGSTDKVHIGDEILQVNYQTVVGWHHSKVIDALKSNVGDITFTLKKRPRHLSQPGQIQRPKQNPFLHPNHLGISSLPYRRPSAGRKRVVVKDDMYLPPREDEKREEEEEEERFGITITVNKKKLPIQKLRPPDTPSEILSPLDSPMLDTSYQLPRGFPLGRRPTMVPGMAHARRKSKVRQDRPRSLPSDLEELRKELSKSSLGKSDRAPEKIKPLPGNFSIPTRKINGSMFDTEPMPQTKSLFPQSDKEDDLGPEGMSPEVAAEVRAPPPVCRKTIAKGVSVKFKEDVLSPKKESDVSDNHSNKIDGVSRVESEVAGSLKGQGSNDSEGVVNTNNNEDTQVPKELEDLIEVVEEADDFVVLDMPSPDQVDGPGRRPPARTQSTSTIDSTDSVILRRHKNKGRFKRGISCADLGPGECEGLLWIKKAEKLGPKWTQMWFVLKEFVLYYYKDQKSDKAKGVICLPGFQVSLSTESKKHHAFKLKHPGVIKDILLAANDAKCLKNWMEKLQLATIMLQDESRVRQSTIITETVLKRLGDPTLLGGYHSSESTDDDSSRKGSYDIPQDSGDSSDATSIGTNSQPGTINSMSPGAAEAIATLKGETLPILQYDSKSYPGGARGKVSRPKAQHFIPVESPPSSSDTTPSSSPVLQRKGCSPRLFGGRSKATKGMQMQYDLTTWEAGKGGIPEYNEVDTCSTKTSVVGSKAEQSEKANKDEFVEEWKKINDVTVKGLDRGTSFRAKKRERPSLKVPKEEMNEKSKKMYQKNMLQRKLKAKQAELESVDRLLGNEVVSASVLTEWREQHDDILKSMDGQSKDQQSSDSDPDSTENMQLSSSMSSINTSSTTTSTHEPAGLLCEDMTTVSDGTTSGCDVQTPMSDTAPAIGEEGEEILKSTCEMQIDLDGSVNLSPVKSDMTGKADTGPVCDDGDSAFSKSNDGRLTVGRNHMRVGTGRSESEASETSL